MVISRAFSVGRIACLVALVGFGIVATQGCSQSTPEVKVVCREASLTSTDAASSIRDVLSGLQQNNLQVFWEFLPPSFRSDVEKLTHEFGDRLDEKSWEPFAATCQKALRVVSQLIKQFEPESETMVEADRELLIRLRELQQLLNAVQKSDLADVTRIRRLDGSRFLSQISGAFQVLAAFRRTDGRGVEDDPFSMLGDVKVELLESKGDTAVLNVQWPGQEPTQHKFVRVEQQWIPQTLAEAWPTEFPKVREQVLAWADEFRSNPEPWHARLRDVDQLLDELAATKSLDEARQVGRTGFSRLVTSWLGLTVPAWPKGEEIPVESSPPAKPVRVKKPDTEVLLPDEPEK